jgi:dTDP-4-amino-4,6-dideoxygalactose transaminase
VMQAGHFTPGAEVASLEASVARACGARFAVGVGSGSEAIELALAAFEIGPGDEVATVSNTDIAATAAITHRGARILWIDVDAATLCLDAASLEERLGPRTRAVIVAHMHGCPAEMDRIGDVAARHGLRVIEDAALAWGARFAGRAVGSLGDIACFSFAPTKILGGYGEAGAVVTDDPELADRVRILANYGHALGQPGEADDDWGNLAWDFVREGWNWRLDELQASILNVKLARVADRIAARRRVATRYSELLAGLPIMLPTAPPGRSAVYRAYTIRTSEQAALRRHLRHAGVETRTYFVPPLHQQPVYSGRGRFHDRLPITEEVSAQVVSVPVHPLLSNDRIEYVATSISRFFTGGDGTVKLMT